jgi:hypothetical protein
MNGSQRSSEFEQKIFEGFSLRKEKTNPQPLIVR